MVACGVGANAQRIMYDVGCASAQLLGRTLLINDAMPNWQAAGLTPQAEALPDIDVPDLYHLAMTPPLYKAMLLRGADFMAGLAPDRAQFQMVLVGSTASAFSGGLSVLAPLCGGCIMLVGAGRARIAEVREAMALVAASGGRVLGTVLVQGSKDVLF
jgi:hypothetical protein